MFVGGVIIMAGHICLAHPHRSATFYLGLVLIAVGTGLLKPNVSVLVGKLYSADDVRRDAGYSLYYMGINTGAFIAPLVTGWLAQSEGFQSLLANFGLRPAQLLALGVRRRRRSGCSADWSSTPSAASTCRWRGFGRCVPPTRPRRRRWTARFAGPGLAPWPWWSLGAVLVATGTVTLDPEAISRSFKWVLIGGDGRILRLAAVRARG